MSATPAWRTASATHSYKHTWKRQVFLNIFIVLLVHKQAVREAALTYFALSILLKFKSRLSLYTEIGCDHSSPCLESLGSFKKQASTNSHFCENRSCDIVQHKPQIFWEGPNCIYNLINPLTFTARSVSLLKILEQARTWWRISSWCRRLIHHSRPEISTAFLIGHIWIESSDLYHLLSGYGSYWKPAPKEQGPEA